MYIDVDAFIIHKRRVSDDDFFISLLSRQHGLLSAFAKSAAKGKYLSQFEPLNHNKIQLYKGAKKFTITQSRITHSYSSLKNNYECAKALFAICEILNSVIAEEESAPEIIFEILAEHLKIMEKNPQKAALLLEAFKIKLCQLLGIINELDSCHHCLNRLSADEETVNFCFDYHGFLCKNCLRTSSEIISISLNSAKLLKFLFQNPAAGICRLELAQAALKETTKITSTILERHCHKTFQAESFFKSSPSSSSLP